MLHSIPLVVDFPCVPATHTWFRDSRNRLSAWGSESVVTPSERHFCSNGQDSSTAMEYTASLGVRANMASACSAFRSRKPVRFVSCRCKDSSLMSSRSVPMTHSPASSSISAKARIPAPKAPINSHGFSPFDDESLTHSPLFCIFTDCIKGAILALISAVIFRALKSGQRTNSQMAGKGAA